MLRRAPNAFHSVFDPPTRRPQPRFPAEAPGGGFRELLAVDICCPSSATFAAHIRPFAARARPESGARAIYGVARAPLSTWAGPRRSAFRRALPHTCPKKVGYCRASRELRATALERAADAEFFTGSPSQINTRTSLVRYHNNAQQPLYLQSWPRVSPPRRTTTFSPSAPSRPRRHG